MAGAVRMRARWALLLSLAVAWMPGPVLARLPDAYGALRVQAGPGDVERRFDLRPAIAQARHAGKSVLLYFGAADCPACKVLERSLAEHAARLAPAIRARYTLIEVEGWLRGARRVFVLPDSEHGVDTLNARFGMPERGRRFIWPTFFALDADTLRVLRLVSEGNQRFLDPDEVEVELDL